jgi:hypothetical protein
MNPTLLQYIEMAAVGGGIGFLSGMFGIGGGVLAVPAMVLVFGFSQHVAQGTSLAIIVLTASVGAAHYWRYHDVDWRAALVFTLGSIIFVTLGAALSQRTSEHWLRLAFAVFMAAVAAGMVPKADVRLFSPVLGAVLIVMGVRLVLR